MRGWLLPFLLVTASCFAQTKDSIAVSDLERMISVLASDSLKGRGNYSPELFKAASFIAKEFSNDSLKTFNSASSYILPFAPGKKLKDKWKNEDGEYDPEKVLYNVVGVLEGKTLPNEVIIFSSHFDHLGGGSKTKKNDNIFNGANDNASGTAAVMALANYFSKTKNNARTLMFCAFGGEELGLLGSTIFAGSLEPKTIIAVINIEMIGRHNVGGKNSFFITGADYSDLAAKVAENLEGTGVKMVAEPDPQLRLFQRSDNLPFALLSVPAHTIMSSNDGDECYHKVCDEVSRIDLEHMKNIINAIITTTRKFVNGTATPSRITRTVDPLY